MKACKLSIGGYVTTDVVKIMSEILEDVVISVSPGFRQARKMQRLSSDSFREMFLKEAKMKRPLDLDIYLREEESSPEIYDLIKAAAASDALAVKYTHPDDGILCVGIDTIALTKRVYRVFACLPADYLHTYVNPLPWFGWMMALVEKPLPPVVIVDNAEKETIARTLFSEWTGKRVKLRELEQSIP